MTNESLQRRISVLIFPTEDKKYMAMPLGLNTVDVKPTLQEALETITRLIDSCILQGALGATEPKFYEIFEQSQPIDYQASLSPEVQRVVSGIDYRVSDQVIDIDTLSRYLKGDTQ